MTYDYDIEDLRKEDRIKRVLNMFNGAGIRNVKWAVSQLDETHRNVFNVMNSLRGDERPPLSVISHELNMRFAEVMRINKEAIDEIKRLLKEKRDASFIETELTGPDVVTYVPREKPAKQLEKSMQAKPAVASRIVEPEKPIVKTTIIEENKDIRDEQKSYAEKLFPNYTKEEIRKVVMAIDDKFARVFLLAYPLDGEMPKAERQIALALDISQMEVEHYKAKAIEIIKNVLEGVTEMPIKETMFSDIETEKMQNALETLTDTYRKIFLLAYPLNGDISKSISEISKITGFTKENLSYMLNVAVGKVKTYLLKKEKITRFVDAEEEKNKRKDAICRIFKVDNISLIEEAVKHINPRYRQVFELRYPLDGSPKHIYKEIMEKTGFPKGSLPRYEEIAVLQIKEYLQTGKAYQEKEKREFDGNDRERIKRTIKILNNKYEEAIVIMKLGLVGGKCYTEEEIAKALEFSTQEIKAMMDSIKIKLETIDKSSKYIDIIYASVDNKVM